MIFVISLTHGGASLAMGYFIKPRWGNERNPHRGGWHAPFGHGDGAWSAQAMLASLKAGAWLQQSKVRPAPFGVGAWRPAYSPLNPPASGGTEGALHSFKSHFFEF